MAALSRRSMAEGAQAGVEHVAVRGVGFAIRNGRELGR